MNRVFVFLIFSSFGFAAFKQLFADKGESPMKVMTDAIIESCESSVSLAIGLIGVMAFFLGLLKIAEEAGLLKTLSRALKPYLVRLFPDIPADHPAMGAIIMNMAANMLGLGNAATPFGIRAMQEMEKLNPEKGTASDSMILFLAINTSSVTLIPTGIIALRAAAGSAHPAAILPTTLFATICSTTVAIIVAKLFSRKTVNEPQRLHIKQLASLLLIIALIPALLIYGTYLTPWLIPSLIVFFVGYGFSKGVDVYSSMVEGAKEGFEIAVKIIPYLVSVLVAVAMFRSSGALVFVIEPLSSLTSYFHLPGEALSMAFLRPLSGSGSYAVVASILDNPATGPDTYLGYLVSTIQGSTETTFYVLAVYFGSVQIKRIRHAMIAGLAADFAGVVAATLICVIFFG